VVVYGFRCCRAHRSSLVVPAAAGRCVASGTRTAGQENAGGLGLWSSRQTPRQHWPAKLPVKGGQKREPFFGVHASTHSRAVASIKRAIAEAHAGGQMGVVDLITKATARRCYSVRSSCRVAQGLWEDSKSLSRHGSAWGGERGATIARSGAAAEGGVPGSDGQPRTHASKASRTSRGPSAAQRRRARAAGILDLRSGNLMVPQGCCLYGRRLRAPAGVARALGWR